MINDIVRGLQTAFSDIDVWLSSHGPAALGARVPVPVPVVSSATLRELLRSSRRPGLPLRSLLLALVCVWTAAVPARAQKAGDVGAGVVIGNPTGGTAKFWLGDAAAVDVGVGYSSRFTVYGDYLWHSWSVLPQPSAGRLPVYLGLGLQARAFHDAELGIRTVVGVAYWLPRDPVELFLEVVPVFRLTPGSSVGLDAGAGLRFYFHG
jgi:hypothetical protein